MKKLNLREHYEEKTEKVEPTLISKELVKHLCKCWHRKPTLKPHTKEVFSDGWTNWTFLNVVDQVHKGDDLQGEKLNG